MATFFSYRGPDNMMDSGFTEHSGCPVLKGEKWITTFWMRDGVTREKPWTIYDPSGVPILDEFENESEFPGQEESKQQVVDVEVDSEGELNQVSASTSTEGITVKTTEGAKKKKWLLF